MVKYAFCYWGQLRTLSSVYESHVKHIYDKMREHNIEYDIYMHTWMDSSNTEADCKLLNPKHYTIDDQSSFIQYIDENFSEYWHKHIYDIYGGAWLQEWFPDRVKRHMYGIESQRRVTQMCIDSKIEYEYVIYLRPDLEILDDIPIDLIRSLSENSILLLNYETEVYENIIFGVNDKFACMPFSKCAKYGLRIHEAKEYRKNGNRLAPEHFLGYIVQKYFTNLIYTEFRTILTR